MVLQEIRSHKKKITYGLLNSRWFTEELTSLSSIGNDPLSPANYYHNKLTVITSDRNVYYCHT